MFDHCDGDARTGRGGKLTVLERTRNVLVEHGLEITNRDWRQCLVVFFSTKEFAEVAAGDEHEQAVADQQEGHPQHGQRKNGQHDLPGA